MISLDHLVSSFPPAHAFRAAMLLVPGCAAAAQDVQRAPAPAPTVQAMTAVPRPAMAAPSLVATNPFDKDRQVWPDRIPPPPPPPPPPVPPAVTDQDMQIYGVIITSEGKRATVKVGKRFAHLASSGRPFANLTEGQTLGEFTLSAIRPDHLVLFAPGGEQRLYFTPRTDRAASPAALVAAAPPPPVQGATNPQVEAASGAPAGAPSATPAHDPAAPAGGATPAANGVQYQGQGAAPAAAPAQPFNLRNSLAAALEASRNGAPRQGTSSSGNAGANPFQKP